MKNKIAFALILGLLVVTCGKKEGSMVVQGNIKGLQKGTLYLQKFQDTLLVSVDSISVNGASDFMLTYNVTEPELYYLTLAEKEDERINFFGEKGNITINTRLDRFATSAEITGSKSHDLLEEYREMAGQFNSKRLDLMKESFEAQAAKDDEQIEKLDKEMQRLIKNRYRYTASFAIKNGKSEVAPYLALTELYDAHITLLDTVNKSLSKKIKASKYGIQLNEFIEEIKTSEVE